MLFSLSQPSSRDRGLFPYVSPVVEIVFCLVMSVVSLCQPSNRDRVLSRYVSAQL